MLQEILIKFEEGIFYFDFDFLHFLSGEYTANVS